MKNKPLRPLSAGLYALCDDSLVPASALVETAQTMLDGGVRTLQLRWKHVTSREAVPMAREIVVRCEEHQAVCLVNDRVDWALVTGAHGVHLGDSDLPLLEARKLLGPSALIGRTVRTWDDIVRAQRDGADHVGLGPVFATRTKQVEAEPIGVEGLRACVARSPLPIVAIAGITLDRIEAVAGTGVWAAAVGSDLQVSGNVADRARALANAFERGRVAFGR